MPARAWPAPCVPLASQVGIDTMKRGGNAVDAAIAMAVTLPLVEPTCNGLGSDCFVLVWSAKDKKLYGLNGSGLAPRALSAQKLRGHGLHPDAGERLAAHHGPRGRGGPGRSCAAASAA